MAWTPTNLGQYAGTCIFLLVFGAVFRALLAVRVHFYEFLAIIKDRRHGGPRYDPPSDEKVSRRPWRAHEAVLMATMDVLLGGVSYLLSVLSDDRPLCDMLTKDRMIAVMTMNVGYFLSVLGGIFTGSMMFSRFITHSAAH